MSDQFIGEIRAFGFSYAPQDWAFCDGSLLPIAPYQALYSVIGITYGGDGKTTFGLPDLRGKAGMGETGNVLNVASGSTTVTLDASTMPMHTHGLNANATRPTLATATGNLPSRILDANTDVFISTATSPALTTLSPLTVSVVGSGLPHENRQPFQTLNFCIALEGNYPLRT